MVGLWLGLRGKNKSEIEKNTLFGTTLVRIKSEIEKNTLFGRALVRVRAKIEKNTLFGTLALVREKHPFF